jgi:HD-GYP domain-containing protein (c-di-GMP phosphodiesterase class II)
MNQYSPDEASTIVHCVSDDLTWSVGVFGPDGIRIPQACLERCLLGNPALAQTHGCAILKSLVGTDQAPVGQPPADLPVNATCDQGCAVKLHTASRPEEPHVLLLGEPPDGNSTPVSDLTGLASALAREVWHLDHENNNLAIEVLRGYEQINLIFDVSAKIAVLRDAPEIRELLVTKLQHIFNADTVYLVFGDKGSVLKADRDGQITYGWVSLCDAQPAGSREPANDERFGSPLITLPPEYAEASRRLQDSHRVFVSAASADDMRSGHGTAMWGVLSESDTRFSTVGVIRRHESFTSGDMLLLDSALTFGGHILGNLHLVEQLQRIGFEVVRTLINALDQKDSYTCGHSERVGFLARVVGQHMRLSAQETQELEWAGLLHDVGKIGIPESVLNKPGRLTPEEYAIIQGHPSRGNEILQPVGSLEPVLQGVLYHHENPDGTGYPHGLKGDDIPLVASIIHVVDVFDALTSTRSYREAFPTEKALAMLEQDAGTKFDAVVVDHFLQTWNELPMTHPDEFERWFGQVPEVVK